VTKQEVLEKLLECKPDLQVNFGVEKIGLFGSYSREEQTEDSDVDILVTFSNPIGWEFIDLKDQLESVLQKKVDLVTMSAIKPQLKEKILREVIFQ
jgi:predicted nucleotidyltransferase